VTVVADTHALHWFLTADERLSERARETISEAQQDPDAGVVVSVATRLDLHYLVRSKKMTLDLARQLWAETDDAEINIEAAAITKAVVEHFDREDLAPLRDPWDRLIVATAIGLDVPLVTKDKTITAVAATGALEVIW